MEAFVKRDMDLGYSFHCKKYIDGIWCGRTKSFQGICAHSQKEKEKRKYI